MSAHLTQANNAQEHRSLPEESEFYRFPRLPGEIRNKIWLYAIQNLPGRIIDVYSYYNTWWMSRSRICTSPIFGDRTCPSLVTNQDSRSLVLEKYPFSIATDDRFADLNAAFEEEDARERVKQDRVKCYYTHPESITHLKWDKDILFITNTFTVYNNYKILADREAGIQSQVQRIGFEWYHFIQIIECLDLDIPYPKKRLLGLKSLKEIHILYRDCFNWCEEPNEMEVKIEKWLDKAEGKPEDWQRPKVHVWLDKEELQAYLNGANRSSWKDRRAGS